MYDILIIGCGPAGLWATIFAALNNKKVCVIESSNFIGGQPMLLYGEKVIDDVPGFKHVRAGAYVSGLIEQFENYKDHYDLFLNTTLESWVRDVNDEKFICNLTNQKTIEAKYIVFCTGIGEFCPKKLTNVENDLQVKNIHYIVNNLNHFKDKKVVIFGGGDSAVDWANILVEDNITKNVSIVHYKDEYKALAKNIEKLRNNKIKEYLNYQLKHINDEHIFLSNNCVVSNDLINDENVIKIGYDEIIVMYGVETNNKNLNKTQQSVFEMKANKFVTDRSQKTSVPNIYAVGQACIYENRPNLMVVAQSEASVAIKSIVNEEKRKVLLKK